LYRTVRVTGNQSSLSRGKTVRASESETAPTPTNEQEATNKTGYDDNRLQCTSKVRYNKPNGEQQDDYATTATSFATSGAAAAAANETGSLPLGCVCEPFGSLLSSCVISLESDNLEFLSGLIIP
jgi:hypothetical protein